MTTAAPTRPTRKPASNPTGTATRKPAAPKLSYNDQKTQIANTVADKILELLDRGDLPPWEKGWHNSQNSTPRNAISNRPYRGVNRWLTMIAQQICGYDGTTLAHLQPGQGRRRNRPEGRDQHPHIPPETPGTQEGPKARK